MKSRSLIVLLLVLTLAVIPGIQLALAASTTTTTTSTTSGPKPQYSERLDVYTVGSNSYWQATLSPVNASRQAIASAESVSGMSAYELTAIKASSATASSQLFWGDGYKVVKLPFIPTTGAFLNVTASSQSDAQAAAADFNGLFGANFIPIGSSGSNYTFFSPAAFSIAGALIFGFVPSAKGGLASMTTFAAFTSLPTPTTILTGVRSGSSFTHAVAFGSTQTGALTSGNLALGSAVGKPNSNFTSSPASTSTRVVVHSLDGLIVSNDGATVSNDRAGFTGTYSMSFPSSSRISPNVTLVTDPPVLSATRMLDRGSAVQGNLVSVTLSMKNTGGSGTIQNVLVNDSWWKAYPSLFAVSAGNWSFTIPSLSAGQNVSRVYVLKVTSSAAEDLTLPPASVSYSYAVGSLTLNGGTVTNQDELRTNDLGPALMIQATTDTHSGVPIGTAARYIVTVTNVGDGPAINLQSGSSTNPTLTQGGGVWKFNATIPVASIFNRNLTQTFTVGWTAPDGSKASLVSNPVRVVFSHSDIFLPFLQFSVQSSLSPGVLKLGTVNVNYTLTNNGGAASANTTVTQTLAAGLSCKSIVNGTAKCTSSGFTLTTGSMGPGANVNGKVAIAFSNDNYQSEPALVTTTYAGATLHTAGNAMIFPAGVVVTKTFEANPVFVGQNDTVTIKVVNQGSLPVFNFSVSTASDSFDNAYTGTLHQTYGTLSPNSPQSFNYTVEILTPGNHTTVPASVAYTFGGVGQSYSYSSGNILVYKNVQATVATKQSAPTEGADFVLSVSVQNPSSVNVSNVSVRFSIPQGITIVNASSGVGVSGRVLTLTLPSLPAGATSNSSVALRASADGSFNLGSERVTFQYVGQTLPGFITSPPITVGTNLLVRYELPIGIAVLITIGVALYMHRKPAVPQAK